MLVLSDFESLEDAQAYEYADSRMVSPDIVVSLLSEHNSVISLKMMADSDNVAAGFLLALTGSVSEFNIITGTELGDKQQLSLAYLNQIGAVTDEFVEAAIYYANNLISKPYESSTLEQFNQAKGTYTDVLVTDYAGQDLKVTIDSDIDCTLTTWDKTEFDDENFGKVGRVKPTNNLTKITTSGKRASGNLYVRVYQDISFTVELI